MCQLSTNHTRVSTFVSARSTNQVSPRYLRVRTCESANHVSKRRDHDLRYVHDCSKQTIYSKSPQRTINRWRSMGGWQEWAMSEKRCDCV